MLKQAKIKLGRYLAKSFGWESLIWDSGTIRRPKSNPWSKSSLIDYGPFSPIELDNLYQTHPIVHACLKLISATTPTPELVYERKIGREWETLETLPERSDFFQLLDRPNTEKTKRNILASSSLSLALHGTAMVQKIRDESGAIVELWPVPMSWILEDRQNEFTGEIEYRLKSAQSFWFPRSDFIRPVFDNPSSNYYGASPTQAAMIEIRSDIERGIYTAEMLVNMKVPGLAIACEQPVSQETRNEIIESVNTRVGSGNRGNLLFLNGGGQKFDFKQLNPMADMDLPGTSSILEARICGVYGVPPIMAQTRAGLDRSTYSNMEQAQRMFYQSTMPIYWDTIAEAITRDLIHVETGSEDWRVRFDYESLPEFQDDEATKSQWVSVLWNAGIITLDEAREAMGFDPSLTDGEQYKPSGGGGLFGDMPADDEEAPEEETE